MDITVTLYKVPFIYYMCMFIHMVTPYQIYCLCSVFFLVVTLTKCKNSPLIVQGPKDKSYETKEWEFAVIDVSLHC